MRRCLKGSAIVNSLPALLLCVLAACGGGGSGQGDNGINRKSIDLSGSDAPGSVATLDQAVGAVSAYVQASTAGPALAAVLGATSKAAKAASVQAKNLSVSCGASGQGSYVADGPFPQQDGTHRYDLQFHQCTYQGGPYMDGPLSFYCDQFDANDSCTHFSEFDFGNSGSNFLMEIADGNGLPALAVTLLGKVDYPANAANGTQQLQAGFYLLNSDGHATAGTAFSIDESYTSAPASGGTSQTHEGSFQIAASGLALGCGAGQFTVSTPTALLVDDNGDYLSGTLQLSASADVTAQFANGQATVSLGSASRTLSAQELLAACGG